MTYFLTKVWGWETPIGPLQFSTKGWRGNALKQLKKGDRVVLVGTGGEQTPEEMKGRILGVMEPTSEAVLSMDFALNHRDTDFVDGDYKWPFGLMNMRAWSVPSRPKLHEITDRKFSMDSAQGIVSLTDEEAHKIETLHWTEEELLQPTAQTQLRMSRKHGAAKRTAPPPTTTRHGVMHMRRAPAYTYALRIIGAKAAAFKIGWAFDYQQRASQFNHASMPELGGLRYVPVLFHLWDTARQAYSMEQSLLTHFADHRHSANNEIVQAVSDAALQSLWTSAVRKAWSS